MPYVKFAIRELRSLGGYCQDPQENNPYYVIVVNKDVARNSLIFFNVILHEVAHMVKDINNYPGTAHGEHWQVVYKMLLEHHLPLFPEEVHEAIRDYTCSPSYRTEKYMTAELKAMETQLDLYMDRIDVRKNLRQSWTLGELPVGSRFEIIGNLHNEFQKEAEAENHRCRCSKSTYNKEKSFYYSSQAKVCRVWLPGCNEMIPEPSEFGLNSKKVKISDFSNEELLKYLVCEQYE